MDGNQTFEVVFLPQSDQQSLTEKPSGGNHREKVRLVCYQDVLILIEHLLNAGNYLFIIHFTVIKNTGAGAIRTLWTYRQSVFIQHFTPGHPRGPGFDINLRVLFAQEIQDCLPWTTRQPTTAGTNSGNGGK